MTNRRSLTKLGTLPLERFPRFQEEQRIVSRNGHLAVDKSYYKRASGISWPQTVGPLGLAAGARAE